MSGYLVKTEMHLFKGIFLPQDQYRRPGTTHDKINFLDRIIFQPRCGIL